MAIDKQAQSIIEWGVKNGKSRSEVETALANFYSGKKPEPMTPEPEGQGIISRTVTGAKNIFDAGAQEITQQVREGGERFAETPNTAVGTLVEKPAILLNTLFRSAGTVGKTAGRLIGEPIGAGITKASDVISDIPEVQRFASNKFVSDALDTVLGGLSQAGENYEEFKQNNPELAKDVEAGTEILLTVLGEQATNKILRNTIDRTRGIVRTTTDALADKARGIGEGFEQAGENITRSIADTKIGERAGALRERVSTNVADKRATEQAIAQFENPTIRQSIRNGVDVNDAKSIQDITTVDVSEAQKSLYRELADTAKQYSESGQRGTSPIEVVGRPVVERLQKLESERSRIGQTLGEVSENLGTVTKPELTNAVFTRLQSTSGLSGLKINEKGILDFSDTTLSSTLSKSDRSAIQQAFNEATKGGSGKSAHLFRQELFEILGGKKKSLSNITDTQEKALEAIRRGLSDVLETKNAQYKELSNEYRKVIQPLSRGRDLLRSSRIAGEAGENVDLLDMKAGILMRRLTGAGASGPEIEAFLRELDAVGGVLGDSAVSTRNLQEMYNVLNRYYDLAPKTGFQSQIKGAIETAGGIMDRIISGIGGTTGQTPAVRQKALENILNELLAQ
jgi:hypothetical protein